MLLSSLVLRAAAEAVLVRCLPLSIDASIPTAGAVDVPTDTVLSVGVSTCAGTDEVVLELRSADGQVLREATFAGPAHAAVLSLDPEGLAQNTDYVFAARGSTSGVEVEVPFTTGTGSVFGLSGAPEIISTDATATWNKHTFAGQYPVVTATDPDVLSIATLHVAGEDMVAVAPVASSGEQAWLAFQSTPAERPREMCVVPGQVDGRGAETLGEELCLDVLGCASAPGGTVGGAAGVAGLLLALRRRAARTDGGTDRGA